jgi:hypothetical protein
MAATLATRRELETVLVLVLILVRGVDLHVVRAVGALGRVPRVSHVEGIWGLRLNAFLGHNYLLVVHDSK